MADYSYMSPYSDPQVQAQFSKAEQDPAYQAAAQARLQQTNAYQIARDASLGMMQPGSVGANGVDYGKAQADPSAALGAFVNSGYTGQQAMSDGWLTGVGSPGWQSTPQGQQLNPNGGNMAAMSPGAPGWGQQMGGMHAGQSSGGPGMFGNSASSQAQTGPMGVYGQLAAQLQQGQSSGGPGMYGNSAYSSPAQIGQSTGGAQAQAGQSSGGTGMYGNNAGMYGNNASSAMQAGQSSGGPGMYGNAAGGQGGNPYGALSSYLDQRSQGGYGGHQAPYQPPPQAAPQPQAYPGMPSIGSGPSNIAAWNRTNPGQAQARPISNPGIWASLGQQLGMGQSYPRSISRQPAGGTSALVPDYASLSKTAGF